MFPISGSFGSDVDVYIVGGGRSYREISALSRGHLP